MFSHDFLLFYDFALLKRAIRCESVALKEQLALRLRVEASIIAFSRIEEWVLSATSRHIHFYDYFHEFPSSLKSGTVTEQNGLM
jgi:hypothetical protein